MAYRRTPKTELQKQERRLRILSEARALIAKSGFSGSRMKDIAEHAGMSEGAIYRYFPTAIELFVEVFREVAGHELEVARQATYIAGPADARLSAALRIHIERALRRPRLAYAMLAEPLAPELEATRLVYRKSFHDMFASVMREAIEAKEYASFDAQTAAACMTGAMDEALIWPLAFFGDASSNLHERIDFVVEFCMNAIAPWQRSARRLKTSRAS